MGDETQITAPATPRVRGSYPTPPDLVDRVVAAVLPPVAAGQRVSVLDPACGDARFIVAAAEQIVAAGGTADVVGIEIEPASAAAARERLAEAAGRLGNVAWRVDVADALDGVIATGRFDVVVGNPPFLSQLAAATTRGGASRLGGGPYAGTAAEFLAVAIAHARPGGGRVGLVLPQSILASRDAGPVRAAVERQAERIWSWWSPRRLFDADVVVCALGFERRSSEHPASDGDPVWTDVITRGVGVADLPTVTAAGTAGDRLVLTANFRDEYYGLVPAVGDHPTGPRLVTSGLIDPNRCHWGNRAVRFNRRSFARPRVDVSSLDERMRGWAARKAGPKLLIANQTRAIECVADLDGTMLPGVPVITAQLVDGRGSGRCPGGSDDRDRLLAAAAVLSSPWAAAWAWHRCAGTGMSARTIRLGPTLLAALPWPAGTVAEAAAAWHAGDLGGSARAVGAAYGLDHAVNDALVAWWQELLP